MKRPWLGGLTTRQFLRRHWQKRPLLVRAALPEFQDPVTPEELAGLACQPHVESRLVVERGGRRPWEVVHGPQDPRRLRRLPGSHWTLLVQEVDKHVPAVARLLEAFDFVPAWRVDDVMVSLAPRSGSVGPHVDAYDVFLLQGRGRRRWRIDSRADDECRRGLDLQILKRFRPESEWVLESGDLLYLPPGVAHHGVALEDCLTYSIGFRAPARAEVLAGAVQRLLDDTDRSVRYRDPDLQVPRHAGAISTGAIARLRQMVDREWARLSGSAFEQVVGELLTEPKGFVAAARRRRVDRRELRARLKGAATLVRDPTRRIAFIDRAGRCRLFVDGLTLPVPRRLAFAAPLLSGRAPLSSPALRRLASMPGLVDLLVDLVNAGAWRLVRGRHPGPRARERNPEGKGFRSTPGRR